MFSRVAEEEVDGSKPGGTNVIRVISVSMKRKNPLELYWLFFLIKCLTPLLNDMGRVGHA